MSKWIQLARTAADGCSSVINADHVAAVLIEERGPTHAVVIYCLGGIVTTARTGTRQECREILDGIRQQIGLAQ